MGVLAESRPVNASVSGPSSRVPAVVAFVERYGLVIVVALAILVRFSTLGAKSYWEDEGMTVRLLHLGFGQMLHQVRVTQPEPPLYFALGWGWARIFGFGEVAVRSLPAAFGVLTIPVAYGAARRLIGRRGALVTAALLAVNPFLVWYSQDGRTYALFVLLAAISLWCVARALERPDSWVLAAWVLTCPLMMEAHYFAVFVIAAEAPWLLAAVLKRRTGRAAWLLVFVTLTVAAIVFAASHSHTGPTALLSYGGTATLPYRMVVVPAMFLVGFEPPDVPVFAAAAACLVAVPLAALIRTGSYKRRGVAVAGSVGAGAIVLALGAALIGHDYINPRNLIAAVVPLWIVIGAGVAASRWGPLSAISLGVLSFVVLALTAWTPKYHYQDWRAVAAAMGASNRPRAVLISPDGAGGDALAVYLRRGLTPIAKSSHPWVSEVDVIATVWRYETNLGNPPPPAPRGIPAAPLGFRLAGLRRHSTFTLIRFVSSRPVRFERTFDRLAQFTGARVLTDFEPGAAR